MKKNQPGIDRARRRKAELEKQKKEKADSNRFSAELLASSVAGDPVRIFECDEFEWLKEEKSTPFGEGPFIKAPEVWVKQYLCTEDLKSAFGGFVFWLSPPIPPVPEMPGRAVVTKGPRRIQRFKKMLIERGARFVIVQGEGPLPGSKSYMGVARKR